MHKLPAKLPISQEAPENDMNDEQKLWGGRFKRASNPEFAAFNRSFGFDKRLLPVDVQASIAHCHGLHGAGVLSAEESSEIEDALGHILERAASEEDYVSGSTAEDVHSFVEAKLIELVGDAGRKLHTGRSRNDQVVTDLRLWVRESMDALSEETRRVQHALLDLADENDHVVIPGYTHLQRAQPVLLAHWCLAYFEMLERDHERLSDARRRANVLPLGSAALAGTSYQIDREAVARELGFETISNNSLDAVSDRDFCVEFVNACVLIMVHLSRLAEDIVLYSTNEFGFFELSEEVATGSSLMPQKKNPDSMELVRGKSGRVFGHSISLLTMLKGLPLAYNKDMQEDKEATFDTFDTVRDCLRTTNTVLRHISIDGERALEAASSGYMNATELADYLVRKGMPFREAHETTGQIVRHALESGVELNELSIADLKEYCPLIEEDVLQSLTLERTLATKSQRGGTAPQAVMQALAEARARLLL
jgi:argininosuccinate lyase